MRVRERILTIRLMEKVSANPAYADTFGIVVQNKGQAALASNWHANIGASLYGGVPLKKALVKEFQYESGGEP